MIVDNDLLSIQQARILAENASMAQRKLATFSQEQLDEIVERVADAVEQHADALAVMSREETDYGRWQDKQLKNRFVCRHVREQLRGMRCVGVIGEDREKHIMDIGVPVGVVVALCPSTSPVSTAVYTTLIAIKSGNAVIFSPHPRAAKSMGKVLDIMIEAAQSHGLPEGCLSYLGTVTKSGTEELMRHAATSLIMISGVPGMLKAAHAAGKPVIFGGTGNGPAFIERTADIRQAVCDIIRSKTFDNGIAPSAEQSIVVDSCIAQQVRSVLQESGAYFMTEEESLRLGELLFCQNGRRRTGMVGVSAATLARKAGISAPQNVTVLIAERKYVSDADPYSRELLSPVLAFYVEDDWMHACEKCIELLLHERNAHTLVIHSGDEEVIRQFALKKPVGRMLVNTPATLGGMGATTNLFPSMILGSGSAGFGITSDNVSPLNFIYTRKVGYGEGSRDGMHGASPVAEKACAESGMSNDYSTTSTMQTVQQILVEAIKAMNSSADR
ncbi:aldehyde dehydrogenase family protein [Desulfovibrio mangrovi]|uniref:aldehyde dehydrogenase family protein n=1 Tax=Desulfovibrio mangrovi TaxID=2976983 RepID=UPI002247252F|nr:aldehyde dehydrogenase family protein [Desulfovibrio mangrovi]UZP66772.1 aldehyde dehydrogenase family protein [Desulfovibrio mangrovi]